MDDSQFDRYFAMLDKTSDRTRSVIYAFIVVYMAILLYAMNAFVYPERQYLYDDVNLQVRCRYQYDPDKCEAAKTAISRSQAAPPLDKTIEHDLWAHQLQLFYDDSVLLRKFKFPIFGLESDRDLLWLIFPTIGMIGYYLIWASLDRFSSIFRTLLNANKTDPVRLDLMLATVIISAPLSTGDREVSRFYKWIWQWLAVFVFAIPIIVSVLTMADQTNAIPALIYQLPDEHFLQQMSPLTLLRLAVEIVAMAIQVGLFIKLVQLALRFGVDQAEAADLIAARPAAK